MTNHPQNSFVLYQDNKEIFLSLDLENRGKLITSIFEYQENGILPTDPLIKIAISAFIAQFKRDSQKWQKTKEDKTIAGKLGNLKRWHPELYQDFINKKKSLEEIESILQCQGLSHTDRMGSDRIGQIANVAVNVSVNDNVSVSNKEISSLCSDTKNDFSDLQSDGFTSGEQKENSEKLTKKERKKKSGAQKRKKEFVAPTLDEVREYCQSRNNDVDAKYFFDLYSAADWHDTQGNEVVNWKQKIITWEARNLTPAKNQSSLKFSLIDQLNQLAGQNLFVKIDKSYNKIYLRCHDIDHRDLARKLSEEVRKKIKEKIFEQYEGELEVAY